MRQWLSDSRDDYEFYMLHAILHDPLRRMALLAVPVTEKDFTRAEYALVIQALHDMTRVLGQIQEKVPSPPSPEFFRTYLESAARQLSLGDDVVQDAMGLVTEMQKEEYKAQHYCVSPFFEAWYSSVRAKKAARQLLQTPIPDVKTQLTEIQRAMLSAHQAAAGDEEDDMDSFVTGTSLERKARRSSGISGLDACLNGGWGDHECYLLFSGTGGGKSIAAGQCAWHEASVNGGRPLIVSTELRSHEYGSRIVSNAASIPIPLIQDCQNIAQIRAAISGDPQNAFRLNKVDEVLDTFTDRIRIHKVSPDDGMDSYFLLEREMMKFEEKMGHPPTWICLDWLGSVADVMATGGRSSSERAAQWEASANGCVRFADDTGIPTMVLAQAVNDAQLKPVLALDDIGISKGIGKNMVLAVGITNTLDKAGIMAAVKGNSDMPKNSTPNEQFFCVCKARKGEGRFIPVERQFYYQRFAARRKAA